MLTEIVEGVFLGDKYNAVSAETLTAQDITDVVTVMSDAVCTTTTFSPLNDGADCSQHSFDTAVALTCETLEEASGGVLIHCEAGRSRSPIVLATALSQLRSTSLEESLQILHTSGRYINPAPGMTELGENFLKE